MNLTKIDWLGFRSKAEISQVVDSLKGCFGDFSESFRVVPRRSGWMGYRSSANLCLADMVVGLMAYGGESQRGNVTVNITGKGCDWMRDWCQVQDSISGLSNFEVRRLDIALDTFKREVTHDKVVQAHRDGLFNLTGRPPQMTRIEPEDPTEGSTVYVGNRKNFKFLRGYQKGYELARNNPLIQDFYNGVPLADIYRLELELKPKLDPLPADLIDKRDHYFAGAYPYLQSVIDVKPETFLRSREKVIQDDLDAMLANIRQQYGSSLFTAMVAYGGDVGAVWDKIVGNKHNQNLVSAGVLLVNHD